MHNRNRRKRLFRVIRKRQSSSKCFEFTASKPDEDKLRPNEDRTLVRDFGSGSYCLALSDGAGGQGVFAGEWAEALLENLPKRAIEKMSDIDDWIGQWWEHFYESHAIKAQVNAFLNNRFQAEGSLATLLAVWLTPSEGEWDIQWLCCGDSVLFYQSAEESELKVLPPHLQDILAFESFPHLLNWKEEVTTAEGCSIGNGRIGKDDKLFLCSDAIAQTLHLIQWLRRAKERDPLAVIELERAAKTPGKTSQLLEALIAYEKVEDLQNQLLTVNTQKDFEEITYQMYQKGLLLRDDYSMVRWSVS